MEFIFECGDPKHSTKTVLNKWTRGKYLTFLELSSALNSVFRNTKEMLYFLKMFFIYPQPATKSLMKCHNAAPILTDL